VGVGFEAVVEAGVVRIALSGDLDVSTAESVEGRLMELEVGAAERVILDLRGLDFIDSTGLSLLINADRRARQAGRQLTIVSGTGAPRRILETTGLKGRLDVVEDDPSSAEAPEG
jgi:anti-sigma B factor antagonist